MISRLHLEIDETDYTVTSLCGGGWRMTRADGRGRHDLAVAGELVTCTCADYRYRQAKGGGRCKHGLALVAHGLLLPAAATPDESHEDPA